MPNAFPPRIISLAAQIGWDAVLLLILAIAVVVFIGLSPYLRHWQALLNRRAVRSMLRGGLLYIFGKRGQRRVYGWRMFYRMRVEVMLRSRMAIRGINRFSVAKLW